MADAGVGGDRGGGTSGSGLGDGGGSGGSSGGGWGGQQNASANAGMGTDPGGIGMGGTVGPGSSSTDGIGGEGREIDSTVGDFFGIDGPVDRFAEAVGGWASRNPGTAGALGGAILGIPGLGMVTGLMGKFGGFKNGIPGGNKAGLDGEGDPEGSSGGSDDRLGQGGLSGIDAGGIETLPRTARVIPGPIGGNSPQAMPTYEQLYAQYEQGEIAPGSESYANPNLFAYGTKAYRYDPTNDYFTSVYSGNQIAKPNNPEGLEGIASLDGADISQIIGRF